MGPARAPPRRRAGPRLRGLARTAALSEGLAARIRARAGVVARRLALGGHPAWLAASLVAVALAGAWREAALTALPEEVVFRGLLLGELLARGRHPALSVAIAAAAFALAHLAAGAGAVGLLTFFPGLLFGALRVAAESLWPAVAAHAVANVLWR